MEKDNYIENEMEEISDETPFYMVVDFTPKGEWCVQQTMARKINIEQAEYEYDCLFNKDGTSRDN